MILRVRFVLILLLPLTLSTTVAFHHPTSNRGHINRRSPPPSLDRSLSDPSSNFPLSSSPSPGLQRSSSSPASLSSEVNLKRALDRSEWSAGSSAPDSASAGSEGSIGRFGPSNYPSPSGSSASEISMGSDGSGRWADTPEREAQDRIAFKPEKERVFGGVTPPKPLKVSKGGVEAQAVEAPNLAPGDRLQSTPSAHSTIIDPTIKLSHPPGFPIPPNQQVLTSVPLSNGEFDKTFSSPANAHIKTAINALPSTPGSHQYVLVSMRDPKSPGGYQIYAYSHSPFSTLTRERINYVPSLLHEVKKIEDGIRETGQDPKKELGWTYQARPELSREMYNYPHSVSPTGLKWKVKSGIVDVKDSLINLSKGNLNRYYTTGGIPAIWGREEIGIGKTIPPEAREVAKKFGEVRVFFDPNNPKDQLRMVYTGNQEGERGELGKEFKTFLVPENKALPLPKEWRGEDVKKTLERMRMADSENFYQDRPMRWEEKVRAWFRSRSNAAAGVGWKERVQRMLGRMRGAGGTSEVVQEATQPSVEFSEALPGMIVGKIRNVGRR